MTKLTWKKGESVATRSAYGKALVQLGKVDERIVVLDADLSGSTKTKEFGETFPERFINVGVAEQDLMGTAAGLAEAGHTVFASTFTIFATGRAWEIVRQSIAYPKMNVKICSSHAGLTVGEDGASHQALEDVSCIRAIPHMIVLVPADANQTARMTEFLASYNGPAYMRLGRANVETVLPEDYEFELGKGVSLKSGEDVCVFVTGYLTSEAMKASEILKEKGVSASVINLPSIKPIDRDLILQESQKHKMLFTVEEHSVLGGLGGAVSEVLCEKPSVPLHRLGMQDEFGQSGPANELLKYYKLDAEGLAKTILEKWNQ